jgi:outer membrane lipoprotein carrier protein
MRAVKLAGALAAVLAFAALAYAAPAGAEEATALDRYLDGLKSVRAEFTQTTLDAAGKLADEGSGKLLVRRPGRFRWEYTAREAGAQLLVADGLNLWFYDRELEQATVKPAAAALGATPIVLLSGTPAELHAAFDLKAGSAREGLAWVQVTPKSASADFASAELGFRGAQLAVLVVHDRLGQQVTLQFTRSERNAAVADSELQFKPPAGVDVIGTPRKK